MAAAAVSEVLPAEAVPATPAECSVLEVCPAFSLLWNELTFFTELLSILPRCVERPLNRRKHITHPADKTQGLRGQTVFPSTLRRTCAELRI